MPLMQRIERHHALPAGGSHRIEPRQVRSAGRHEHAHIRWQGQRLAAGIGDQE
jgi:hypothetical protein